MNMIDRHKFCDSYSIDEKISYICENECNPFLKLSNVVGIARGYKIINGFYTCEKCITVFVTKKLPINKLKGDDIIPTIYRQIKTDVVQSDVFRAQGLKDRIRPTLGGYSLGPNDYQITGSLGCLVKDKHDVYILCNNHIIAFENKVSLGAKILQPGRVDGGTEKKDIIGVLSKYIPIKFENIFYSPTNYVDCAMAKVLDKSQVSSSVAIIGRLKGITKPQINEFVKKVGRTTGESQGIIRNLDATIKVHYVHGEVLLKKQIITSKMTEIGDSGSIIVNNDNYVVGLVVGSSTSESFHNDISLVLKNLKVDIVTDD